MLSIFLRNLKVDFLNIVIKYSKIAKIFMQFYKICNFTNVFIYAILIKKEEIIMNNQDLNNKLKQSTIIPLNVYFIFTDLLTKEENFAILEQFIADYFEIPLEIVKTNLKLVKNRLKIINEDINKIDLILSINDKIYNIEILTEERTTFNECRSLFFAFSLHSIQSGRKNLNFSDIENTIQINLNNFSDNFKSVKDECYFRDDNDDIFIESFRMDFVSLTLGKERWYSGEKNNLNRWCAIFLADTEEELKSLLTEDFMNKETSEKLLSEIKRISHDEKYIDKYIDVLQNGFPNNNVFLGKVE